jgi:hypothetical protein
MRHCSTKTMTAWCPKKRSGRLVLGHVDRGKGMGLQATTFRRQMRRNVRERRLSDPEKLWLGTEATYEGSPYHKRHPGDFGLIPPSQPRADKTLCDVAGITTKAEAQKLLEQAIAAGLVSESERQGYPHQLWAVDSTDRVYEFIYGGSRTGAYHGYPIRRNAPFASRILQLWRQAA